MAWICCDAASMCRAPVPGALLVVAATVGFAACGSAGEDGCSENASYASVVRFNGVLHTGGALSEGAQVSVGRPVGTGSFFGGRTRYRGPRRAGLPYLRGGERLVVRGRACRGTRVVAQLIRARR